MLLDDVYETQFANNCMCCRNLLDVCDKGNMSSVFYREHIVRIRCEETHDGKLGWLGNSNRDLLEAARCPNWRDWRAYSL